MLSQIKFTFLSGLLWLFVFSIPVGFEKRVFDVGYHYIVDTTPVKWVAAKTQWIFEAGGDAAKGQAVDLVRDIDEKYSKTKNQIQESLE